MRLRLDNKYWTMRGQLELVAEFSFPLTYYSLAILLFQLVVPSTVMLTYDSWVCFSIQTSLFLPSLSILTIFQILCGCFTRNLYSLWEYLWYSLHLSINFDNGIILSWHSGSYLSVILISPSLICPSPWSVWPPFLSLLCSGRNQAATEIMEFSTRWGNRDG